MNTTRSATLRAKPISWVTTSMVMPSWARSTITSSTSLIISGSRAEVGSSNSMATGSMASARAMATRCCWPPESSEGYLGAWSARPTRSSRLRPFSSASPRSRLSTLIWPSSRLSSTLLWGNSSKCWNTMPTRARSRGRLVERAWTSMPSTTMRPASMRCNPLTHWASVLLPEPEGPHTTTTWPRSTTSEQSLSAWKSPNHLSTCWMSIIRCAFAGAAPAGCR